MHVNPIKEIHLRFTLQPTNEPFQRIHIYLFPFATHRFLLAIDSFSICNQVEIVNNTSAQDNIEYLDNLLSIVGIPQTLICDNGPLFTSWQFSNWCKTPRINLIHSPPYHPKSNGLSEIAVQEVKALLEMEHSENVNPK